MKAAETLCVVCWPPGEHISWDECLGDRPSAGSRFMRVDHQICVFVDFKTVK